MKKILSSIILMSLMILTVPFTSADREGISAFITASFVHNGGSNISDGKKEELEITIKSVSECIDCDYIVEIKTNEESIVLGLGAIITIDANNCKGCLFEEEKEDIEDITATAPTIGLGTIIAIEAENIEDDEDVIVHCKVTKIDNPNIECEVVSINEKDFYRIEGHQGKETEVDGDDVYEKGTVTFVAPEVVAIEEPINKVNFPCTGPEDTSVGCDGVNAESRHVGGGGGSGKCHIQDLSIKEDGGDRLTENCAINGEETTSIHKLKVRKAGDNPLEYIVIKAKKQQTRAEFKAERKEYIATYKGAFVKRIGNRLDNIPAKNLEKALVKINAKIDKVEANENMADNAKESLMDALFALIEIVELKLEGIDGE